MCSRTVPTRWGRSPFYRVKQMWPLERKKEQLGRFRRKVRQDRDPRRSVPATAGNSRRRPEQMQNAIPAQAGTFRRSPKHSGGSPGVAETPAETPDRKCEQKNCNNFFNRTPILANLGFLECSQQELPNSGKTSEIMRKTKR